MEEQNLRTLYPLSFRWVALRILPSLVATLVLALILDQILLLFWPESFETVMANFILLCASLVIVRGFYLVLYYKNLRYSLIDDEFYIVRGILFKKPIGIPIKKINAIHIERSALEIILGLATLTFVVPGDVPRELLSLSGFSKYNAAFLKSYIFSRN